MANIRTARDFPTPDTVESGYFYYTLNPVTDDDPGKTNTGQSFAALVWFWWDGIGWTEMGGGPITPASSVTFDPTGTIWVSTNLQTLGMEQSTVVDGKVDKVIPSVIDDIVTFSGLTGQQKNSGFSLTDFYLTTDFINVSTGVPDAGKPIVLNASGILDNTFFPGGTPGENNTASNLGVGLGVFALKAGVDLQFKSLVAGADILLIPTGSEIQIAYSGSAEANTASNLGFGAGMFATKVGVDLQFKSLVAGTNVTLTPTGTDVTIDVAGGVGEANTSSNSGIGQGLVLPKVGVDLPFKSLIAGTNITLTPGANDLTINASGGGASYGMGVYDVLVDAAGGGDYTSVSAAINASAVDARIYILDGLYNETVQVAVKRDQFIGGQSREGVIIDFGGNAAQINIFGASSSNMHRCHIESLTIKNSSNVNGELFVHNFDGVIKNIDIDGIDHLTTGVFFQQNIAGIVDIHKIQLCLRGINSNSIDSGAKILVRHLVSCDECGAYLNGDGFYFEVGLINQCGANAGGAPNPGGVVVNGHEISVDIRAAFSYNYTLRVINNNNQIRLGSLEMSSSFLSGPAVYISGSHNSLWCAFVDGNTSIDLQIVGNNNKVIGGFFDLVNISGTANKFGIGEIGTFTLGGNENVINGNTIGAITITGNNNMFVGNRYDSVADTGAGNTYSTLNGINVEY